MIRVFILFVLTAVPVTVSSQKLTSSYGKATKQDLEMSFFDGDTTAPAVVLYQSGYLNSNTLEFTFFRRIKILKKAGTNLAEFTFNADENSFVRGRTLNLVNGKIVEDKLGKKSIFRQQVSSGNWFYRIAMPNVREGSVIEIEYKRFLLPVSYKFEDRIPVVRAELLLEENPQINFRKTQSGYTTIRSTRDFFYADYVPAFKTESFMNSPENYITRFDFDILSISLPGFIMGFTTDWEAVNELLLEDTYFGKVLSGNSSYLDEITKMIEGDHEGDMARMKAAYEAIKEISWNNEVRLYSSGTGLRPMFTGGSANSSEINMMLCQLLQKLGMKSSMIAMSTRENGLLNPVYPSLQKLNYAIVYAEIEGNGYVMDATEKQMPFGMLPFRALNQQGRLVERGAGKWIDLTPERPEKVVVKCDLRIDESDQLAGKVSEEMEDYAAFRFRKDYHLYTSDDEFAESLEKVRPGFNIRDFRLTNIDDIYQNCVIESDVIVTGRVQKAGDLLIINPFIAGQFSETPFKNEERVYPVDFTLRQINEYSAIIEIPDGYEVQTLPAPANYKTKDRGLDVTFLYSLDNGSVIVSFRYEQTKIVFLPVDYPDLREVYSKLIAKQAEPVVLKRRADERN